MTDVAFYDRLISFLIDTKPLKDKIARNQLLDNLPEGPRSCIQGSEAMSTDLREIVNNVKTWGRILDNDRHALEIMMDNVKQHVKGTEREKQLEELRTDFQRMRLENIHIAVVAMTHDEAQQLDSGVVPYKPSEIESWKELKSYLNEHMLGDFTSYYKESRDEWVPFFANGKPIKDVLQEEVDDLNKIRRQGSVIELEFLSSYYLSADRHERSRARSLLTSYGGVVIIDAISMYHTDLRDVFFKFSLLSPNNPVAVIVVSPLERNRLNVNANLEKIVYHNHLEVAFERFTAFDPRYKFGIDDMCCLQRWLYLNLLADRHKSPYCKGIGEAFQRETKKQSQNIYTKKIEGI